MRIAMIGQRGLPARYGGIEHHVHELGRRMVAAGHEVTVFCRPGYTPDDLHEVDGIKLAHLPTVDSKHMEALVHSGRATMSAVKDRGFDVVHYHALGPGIFAPLARAGTRSAIVQTIHGLDDQRGKWGRGAQAALRLAKWMSTRSPHRTIVVSRDLQRHYAETAGRASTYIGNAAPPPDLREADLIRDFGLEAGKYVLWMGRLVPEKAPDLLIKAFRQLDTDLKLAIVGGSSNSDAYTEELHDLAELDPRVVMTGYAYDDLKGELYTNAAAFAFPSRLEGLPLTLLEAASYELPILASSIPPHVEVLQTDGPGHRLVADDDVACWAQALQHVLADLPGEKRGAIALSRNVGEHYSWDAFTDATLALYTEAVTEVTGRAPAPATPAAPELEPFAHEVDVRDALDLTSHDAVDVDVTGATAHPRG